MDYTNIITQLNDLIAVVTKDTGPAPDGAADFKRIAQRDAAIKAIGALKSALGAVTERLATELNSIEQAQHAELSAMTNVLAKFRPHPDAAPADQWETVSYKSSFKRRFRERQLAPTPPAPANTNTAVPRQLCKFTEALALKAIPVSTFADVRQDGELYYVTTAEHFAFYLAGQLFHGNIGVIYTDEKSPVKIKDCKFANECIKKGRCDYYHDPLIFSGYTDKRNFIASSWLYSPPNSQYKNKTRSRRFGSLEHLDMDIVDLQADEARRFYDQTMHDVLCSLLLMNYHCSRGVTQQN